MIAQTPFSTSIVELRNPALIDDIETFESIVQSRRTDNRIREFGTMSRAIMFRLGPPKRVASLVRHAIGDLFTRAALRAQSSKLPDREHIAAGLRYRRRLLLSIKRGKSPIR